MDCETLFTPGNKALIEAAIRLAESGTSGEIRVHVDDQCEEEVLDHAAFVFAELEMHHTTQRNGVLIYIALENQKLAIIGDSGIHAKVGNEFWDSVRQLMTNHFRQGEFVKGICEGIKLAGEKLSAFFPYEQGDKNELSNTITSGKHIRPNQADR